MRLFFPRFATIPTDTLVILREFVPTPEPFTIPTRDAPPETHTCHNRVWFNSRQTVQERVQPVRVRETAAHAEADVRAVLRLIDAGKVRVTDKKLVPTEATRQLISEVLSAGDFYTADDASTFSCEPAADISIMRFAWPVLMQAGRLAEKRGDALRLTVSGKNAVMTSPTEVIRTLWETWLNTRDFDEFARIDAIKGQGRARMSAVAERRTVVTEALAACPVGRWILTDDFFRLIQATGDSFTIAHAVH